jgi:muramoyltetrapeptide carboxypeptidase
MTSELLKPQNLKTSDKVALVSPVNLPPPQYRNDRNIVQYLYRKGFAVSNFIAPEDTPKSRADAFNAAIESGAKALFPVAGNRFGADIVDKIDYDSFQRLRPVFCTFSAASTLLLALQERSNVSTFYGPHISFIHSASTARENSYTITSFWNMLTRDNQCIGLEKTFGSYIFRYRDGDELPTLRNIFSGENNLSTISSEPIPFIGERTHQSSPLVLGKLLPAFLQSYCEALRMGIGIDFTKKVVMTEMDEVGFDAGLRLLAQLADSSNLKQASAVIFTNFITHKTNPPNQQLQKELYDPSRVEDFMFEARKIIGDNVPVIYGFPMGHSKYKLTVPMGIEAELNIENGDITLLESPFAEGVNDECGMV